MKKFYLITSLLFSGLFASAQNGLENIVVETYYISNASDTVANLDGGVLPVGSVTYRIYADMLPGYKFQAAYGVPGHDLKISTTTLFWNNEDRGSTSPTFSKTNAARNTVMLDSWLSVGAACNGNFGIMKSMDDGMNNINNNYSPQVLQNNDPAMGIPLTVQDGFIAGTPEALTAVGISSEITVFDNQNDGTNGPLFMTNNGSWASLNGSTGPDPIDNKVLIAQITTNGTLSFELNIQIGTPTGGVENYVASNPVTGEISIPSLTYTSPSIGIYHPTNSSISFSAFPNPVESSLFVNTTNIHADAVDYFVYDLTGKKVIGGLLSLNGQKNIQQISVDELNTGLYFIELTVNGVTSTQKFIKK
ncbi:MAG: T9SS type A sorting domain-containing protein [Bacteroidota bacterium]